MKKQLLFLLIIPFVFSCNTKQKELESLQAKYDSIMSLGFTKDTALYSYIATFNSIQANLDSIKRAEMIIAQNTSGNGELQMDQKEQINRDINMIYELLQQNKKTIAELRAKASRSGGKAGELQKMIDNMAAQIEEKDSQISVLRDHLEMMNIEIDVLTADLDIKSQTISEQSEELNTAWFVIGTKRELLDRNIITREGGFAGIASNKTLKKDFSRDYFTTIDIHSLRSIPLSHKKISMITSHPSQSYTLYGDKAKDSLVINNPKEFWSVSKYLVIMVD